MRKVFLFGSSSFLMKELAYYLSLKKNYQIICLSREEKKTKIKNVKNYTTDYSNSSLKKIFDTELPGKSTRPIFIFGNVITQSELFINLNSELINPHTFPLILNNKTQSKLVEIDTSNDLKKYKGIT